MPIIQLNIAEGRTTEQKASAMQAITEAVVRTLGARPDQVRIMINEVSPTHYSIAGESIAARNAKATEAEKKKP